MEDELIDELQIDPFHNVLIQSVITHNPARVTQWITNINAYLSLPTVEPKIVYLTLLPLYGEARVLQILVHCHCLLFHLFDDPPQMPDSLRQFLANELYTFVGGPNIDLDLLLLYEYFQIEGNVPQRLDLSSLDRLFTSRPLQFFLTDWRVEKLGAYEVRFYAREGFATYLISQATYRVAVSFYTAFLLFLLQYEQLAGLD